MFIVYVPTYTYARDAYSVDLYSLALLHAVCLHNVFVTVLGRREDEILQTFVICRKSILFSHCGIIIVVDYVTIFINLSDY